MNDVKHIFECTLLSLLCLLTGCSFGVDTTIPAAPSQSCVSDRDCDRGQACLASVCQVDDGTQDEDGGAPGDAADDSADDSGAEDIVEDTPEDIVEDASTEDAPTDAEDATDTDSPMDALTDADAVDASDDADALVPDAIDADVMADTSDVVEDAADAVDDTTVDDAPDLPPSQLWHVEAESDEAQTTTGQRRSDHHNLWSEGSVTTDIEVPYAGTYALRARVWADQCCDGLAEAELLVAGEAVDTVDVTAASRAEAEVLSVEVELPMGAQTVGVRFTNDMYIPEMNQDRNLLVDWLELEGPL